eukprot:4157389-Prymnesium_polylepis.2
MNVRRARGRARSLQRLTPRVMCIDPRPRCQVREPFMFLSAGSATSSFAAKLTTKVVPTFAPGGSNKPYKALANIEHKASPRALRGRSGEPGSHRASPRALRGRSEAGLETTSASTVTQEASTAAAHPPLRIRESLSPPHAFPGLPGSPWASPPIDATVDPPTPQLRLCSE